VRRPPLFNSHGKRNTVGISISWIANVFQIMIDNALGSAALLQFQCKVGGGVDLDRHPSRMGSGDSHTNTTINRWEFNMTNQEVSVLIYGVCLGFLWVCVGITVYVVATTN
jgi:hypothetical protein